MTISFIVAAAENNVIGRDNMLPWHLPTDMKYFKNMTWGMTVVMGRKSFEALGKPLKGRRNIVITRNPEWGADGVEIAHSLDEAIRLARENNIKEVFITGGAEIFNIALPLATTVYLTRVHGVFDGDTYFPVLSPSNWRLAKNKECAADEKNSHALSFQVWKRI